MPYDEAAVPVQSVTTMGTVYLKIHYYLADTFMIYICSVYFLGSGGIGVTVCVCARVTDNLGMSLGYTLWLNYQGHWLLVISHHVSLDIVHRYKTFNEKGINVFVSWILLLVLLSLVTTAGRIGTV